MLNKTVGTKRWKDFYFPSSQVKKINIVNILTKKVRLVAISINIPKACTELRKMFTWNHRRPKITKQNRNCAGGISSLPQRELFLLIVTLFIIAKTRNHAGAHLAPVNE